MKYLLIFCCAFMFAFGTLVPSVTLAQSTSSQQMFGLKNPFGTRTVPQIIGSIIRYASGIAGAAMLAYVVWGGIEYMTAEDQKAVQAATQRIVWAVIGIVVIMLAYAFVDMIVGLSNIPPGG